MVTSVATHFALEEGLRSKGRTNFRLLISLIIFCVVMVMVAFVFSEVDHQLKRSRTVESDNRTWVIAQLEVDIRRLEVALLTARLGGATDPQLEDVRLAYDILYSRVDLARHAETLNGLPLRESPGWQALAGPDGLVARFLPLIDGSNAGLRDALVPMTDTAHRVAQPLREALVDTFANTLEQGDVARDELRRSLYGFMIALGVILVALALLLLTIYLQSQVQVRHAQMLELALHNLRTTIEASRDAVLIVDNSRRIIGANEAGGRMLGVTVKPDTPLLLDEVLVAGQISEAGVGSETRVRRADGTMLPVEVTLSSALTATGYTFTIAFLRDMSEQLERENRLAEALQAARQGEETKDRFLAVMSHEMRTPLNGLLSAIDLLESSGKFDEHQDWLMDIVRGCAQATLEQVNNVLELTRLAARAGDDYPASDFDLQEVVEQQVRQFEVLALRRGNLLTLDVAGVQTRHVRAPLPLLRRIMNNLIANAIKFTRDGKISVTLSAVPQPGGKTCRVTVAIRDTGIGIEEANLERIFHNFETLDSSYSRMQEGSGLGLGIAKLAAEAMGGTIAVESMPGVGSCFTITFDAQVNDIPAAPAPAVPEQPQRAAKLDILLAEDNDINRMLLERQLVKLGHRVTAVADGVEAVEAAEEGHFDIVLMDVSMPRMDGLTACRTLRERGLLGQARVIALTAQAEPSRVKEFREAGMDEVVTKPAHIAMLDDTMQRMVADTGPAPEQPAQTAQAPDLLDHDLLAELLEDMGQDFLATMLEKFHTDIGRSDADMRAALVAGDRAKLAQVSHKAAGAAAVLTYSALAAALRALEHAAADEPEAGLQQRLDAVSALVVQSETELRTVLDEI